MPTGLEPRGFPGIARRSREVHGTTCNKTEVGRELQQRPRTSISPGMKKRATPYSPAIAVRRDTPVRNRGSGVLRQARSADPRDRGCSRVDTPRFRHCPCASDPSPPNQTNHEFCIHVYRVLAIARHQGESNIMTSSDCSAITTSPPYASTGCTAARVIRSRTIATGIQT